MGSRKIEDFPSGRRFRFDYEPTKNESSTADDIIESMNRSLKAEDILRYDPQLEAYFSSHEDRHSREASRWKPILAFMLFSTLIAAWLYGFLGKVTQSAFWKSQVGMFGYALPLWLIGIGGATIFLIALLPRGKEHLASMNEEYID